MQKRIFKNNIVSILISAILLVSVCFISLGTIIESSMKEQAYSQTMLLMHILENSDQDLVSELEEIENEIYGRITFIDTNGDVKYDSDFDTENLPNHQDREEFIEAKNKGIYIRQRVSDTTSRITYYCAAKVNDRGVIRIAITLSNLSWETIMKTGSALWISVLIIIFTIIIISGFTTQKIVDNIEQYDTENGEVNIYPELSHFVNKIKSQNEIINLQIQNLIDEKAKLQSVFSNIKEGIVVCDSKGIIVQSNKEARKVFNIKENMKYNEAIDIDSINDNIKRALNGEESHGMFKRDSKSYKTITSPIVYLGETGVVLIFLDITQQIENEENRRQFTDNVTHELKTPLTSIYGYSQLITNGMAKQEDIKTFAEIIENNAKTLLDMIDDIIKISNMESGYGFKKEILQLDEIVKKVIEQEKFNAENNNVTIISKIEPITILADENQMYQLVTNLIVNAIKYNKDNGKIFVKLSEKLGYAQLIVEDTGIGIPNDKIEQIFERFYVVDKSRNKNRSSTGLGLSIVKHIVKVHNGFITVKSKVGEGTKFITQLPMN